MSPGAGLPLNGQGVVLRRLTPADLTAFQGYRRLPEVGRFQSWTPMTDAEALAFLRASQNGPLFVPGQWFQIGVAEPEGNQLIGDMGVCVSADRCDAELGFTLSPAWQGQGLATAAVRAVLPWVFAQAGVSRVIGITDARNQASVRVLRRVGMQRVAVINTVFRGEACEEETYALSRSSHG